MTVRIQSEEGFWKGHTGDGFDHKECGLTLVELVITITILGILGTAAMPVASFEVKREKERELRKDLWEMRDSIDRYHDAVEKGGVQVKADSFKLSARYADARGRG